MGTERDFIPAPDALIKGLLECLHHTLRSERGAGPVADDQMIHEPDIDRFHGRTNAARNPLVGLAWFSDGRASVSAWQGPRQNRSDISSPPDIVATGSWPATEFLLVTLPYMDFPCLLNLLEADRL